MAYSKKVLDHYDKPRNVGAFDKKDPTVGTGLVGAPACGDVMKLQIKVGEREYESEEIIDENNDDSFDNEDIIETKTVDEDGNITTQKARKVTKIKYIIEDVKFKTFGCGSAIAASSLATEKIKHKTLDFAQTITNKDLATELELPPVKIHCSVLAEDAIKAAIKDFMEKQQKVKQGNDNVLLSTKNTT